VSLTQTGQVGDRTVRRTWKAEDELTAGSWTEQTSGMKQAPYDEARWRDALETYRPFLPYSELGKLVGGKPSELYDAVHRLLGLEMIMEAQSALRTHRLRLSKEATSVRDRKRHIITELSESTDERAQQAAALLSKQKPDLDAIATLAISSDVDAGQVSILRRIAEISVPTSTAVEQCREQLASALRATVEATTENAVHALRGSELLTSALHLHDSTGDGPCPVCEVGILDGPWREVTERRAQELRLSADALQQAGIATDTALADAWLLCEPPPAALSGDSALVDCASALATWESWHLCTAIGDPTELRDELLPRHAALVAAVETLREAAREQMSKLDLVWRPLAATLIEWHGQAEQVQADAQLLADVTAAEDWIKRTATDLRSERMAPFATQSQRVWEKLRQQSSVDLGAITLEGNAVSNRRVELNVSVDGIENTALAVMSQGELHALGLSLFLPRATVDESPFRFVVIDDPVQAMDPAKVDGLARVLDDVARTRQVVVFTHDERLAEAVRRLQLPATVWEVHRREHSVVEVRRSDGPVERYLSDARALVKTDDLPSDLQSELVTTFCRSALEAAAHTKVRRERLARGVPHHEVEEALATAIKVHDKVTLAVFDDPSRGTDLYGRLNSFGPWAANVLRNCKRGAHVGFTGDLGGLISDTKRLADRILL
jgi:ABC-type lipoprotein export system ATPase subunit